MFIATIYADGLLTNITCCFVLLARQLLESSSGLSERIGGKKNRSHGLDKSFFNRGIPSNFGQTHLILVSHYIQFYPILCHRKLGLSGLFQPIIGN